VSGSFSTNAGNLPLVWLSRSVSLNREADFFEIAIRYRSIAVALKSYGRAAAGRTNLRPISANKSA
jgi:hypothetical protein